MQYFKGYKGANPEEINAFNAEFERLKSVTYEHKTDQKLQIKDFSQKLGYIEFIRESNQFKLKYLLFQD